MDDQERQHLEKLLGNYRKHLNLLQQKAAMYGLQAPPHIQIEIENDQHEIERLELQLRARISAADRLQLRRQAEKAFRSKDWERAVDLLSQLAAITPQDANIKRKLTEANKQFELHTSYQVLCDLRYEDNWQAVLEGLDELELEQPDYPDPEGLRQWAKKWQRYERASAEARAAFAHQDWDNVILIDTAVLIEFPDDTEAQERLARARLEDERQRSKVSSLYEQAQLLRRSNRWRAALSILNDLERQAPGHPDPDGLWQWAHSERAPIILGIDLGTTNACMAAVMDGGIDVIPNAEGERLTPAVVSLTEQGEWLVGQQALRAAVTNPRNTIFSAKRLIGRKLNDERVQTTKRLLPYQIASTPGGDISVLLDGYLHSLEQILAMVLRKLVDDAEALLNCSITQVVMTVPNRFDYFQRELVRQANELAGLEIQWLISRSTAAALAYGWRRTDKDETIVVYDLGSGTLDISVLETGDGVFEVKAVNSDLYLGGDDFDLRIVEWLVDEFRQATGIELTGDPIALQRLRKAAEEAKRELSIVFHTEINLPFIAANARGPRHLSLTLTRAKLEQLTADLIEKTIIPIKQALADAGLRPNDINEIILVGGQTRMPAVQEAIQRFFNRKPHKGVNPDEVVALGAAIQAGVLAGDVKDVLLLDVTPLTLGIETHGGVMTPLIERNTTIPTRKSQVFSTSSDGQSSVEVHVLQGERAEARLNKSLSKFVLDGIRPAPRGRPQIEVTFDIDARGILIVSAKNKATGKKEYVTIPSADWSAEVQHTSRKAVQYPPALMETD